MRRRKSHTTLGATMLVSLMAIAGCGASDPADPAAVLDPDNPAAAATSGDDANGDAISSQDSEAASSDNQTSHFDADDLDYNDSEVVEISLEGTSATVDSADVTTEGSTVTVAAAGTYSLSGTLSDGEVIVDAEDSDEVMLILDGVDITNSDGAAISVMNADEAVVVLADGSANRLSDGATYLFPDVETDEPNATLYSTADLTIAGGGELIVNGAYNDGIASKDGLVIASGSISVLAADDGIRGKDYVIVDAGTVWIEAGGDGIKADNDEDEDRGYVQIAGGVIGIGSGDDGVQAATDVIMSGGELTIGAGDDGIHGDYLVAIDGGSITVTDAYEGIESEVIIINDGFIDITSSDDGLNVATADETADTTDQAAPGGRGGGGPGGGDAAVGEHYIYINGGTTVITITDDLAEQGDGIDANGHIEMTGGVVAVSGPTDTRNSALDYSGGTFEMTGGTFIGTNVDGRNSEGIGSGSSQASLYVTPGSTISAGTVVHVEAADGESLVTFEPANDYSVIVFSSPELVDGETYDIYLGGTITGDSVTSLYEASAYTGGDLSGTATASL